MTTIFFVEDDQSLQEIAMLIFPEPDFKLIVFNRAEELLSETSYPHVYVLDKQLPGMDGLDLCRMLKSNPSTQEIPVVILSAAPNITELAANSGADAVLEKPFSVDELQTLITAISA